MMKEYILCAAVKHGTVVITGYRHEQCYTILEDILGEFYKKSLFSGKGTQGFLTSKNRFVDRFEGFTIAKKVKQITHNCHDPNIKNNILISEDLY